MIDDIMENLDSGDWDKLMRVWLTADNDQRVDPEELADALYEAA